MSDLPSPESQRIFAPGTFQGQVALVTGGGSGIGLATACELARLGAKVVICGRTRERLEEGERAVSEAAPGAEVLAPVCDIRQPEQIDALLEAAKEHFGGIDILVNNAGGQFPAPASQISPKGFEAVVRNNLLGTFNVTSAVAKQSMLPRRRGRIVNVIANIYRGFPGMVHTGAARAGVENMTMTLAVEWARFGVRVNAVAPGVIRSSGTERYGRQIVDAAAEATPVGRAGSVEEVAASILFLASPAADYINGATLYIDGGQRLRGDTFPIPEPSD